jgi:hypothetical protein
LAFLGQKFSRPDWQAALLRTGAGMKSRY